MDKYFKQAGDLNAEKYVTNDQNYFKPAGNLKDNYTENSENYIKNYLLEIVSGKHLVDVIITEAGSMIIPFNELQKMAELDNYNIIKAQYLNPEMIIVEYEKYQKDNNKIKF